MGKWADEFRAKFESDINQARINTERAVQKQKAVEAKQTKLWVKLRTVASSAVDEINESGDGDVLQFREPGEGSINQFAIIYTRSGETRTATAKIDFNTHTLLVEADNGRYRQEFVIRANDNNDVEFVLNVSYSPETIVSEMLNKLL